ncbi:MAG: 6-phosphogluconolactonase [bacterium]|nr:6-phosphogluconolactonase [bacterium]
MAESARIKIGVHPSLEALSQAAAAWFSDTISRRIKKTGVAHVCLSGGNTPQELYRLLATEYSDKISWEKVHFYWGDERYVAPTDPHSNFRAAYELLFQHVPIQPTNVHPMPTGFEDPEMAAADYERVLREQFDDPFPEFDVVLLGMGADGHTASLFPGSRSLGETERWVVAVSGGPKPRIRLSLTLSVFNAAANVVFMVAGAEKADAARMAIECRPNPAAIPASGVRPVAGSVTWMLDEDAAKLLKSS